MPCVENCTWEECGNELECNIDEITKTCEEKCESEKDISQCKEECKSKCIKDENTWVEPEKNEWKEEKGAFAVGGGCRKENVKTNAFLWFNGWGESFEQIQPLKERYYMGGQAEWCKWELEDLQKQRKEFEKSFNYEFAQWFFEKYLANSAENWKDVQSGIYEIYWQGGADLARQISERMYCLGLKEIPFDYKLINFTYETEYGKVEYWEELKTIDFSKEFKEENSEEPNSAPSGEEIEIITPYMKVWIFPSKEFIIYEMKKAMEEGKFPGSEGESEKNIAEEIRQGIGQIPKFREKVTELSNKYGGSFDISVQLKNYEKNEIVYNLFVEMNEENLIEITPMLPEEMPENDGTMIINFDKIYELISLQEKEMRGDELQSPPWDKKPRNRGINQATNKVKEVFKIL